MWNNSPRRGEVCVCMVAMLMTYAKHARGLMARFMVQHRITDPEDLKAFNLKQYTFNPRLSDQNDWVFTRDVVEL